MGFNLAFKGLIWGIARGYLLRFYSWYIVKVELLLYVQCAPKLDLFGIENTHHFGNIVFWICGSELLL